MKRKSKTEKSILLRLLILGVSGLWKTLNESKAELKNLKEQYATLENDIEEYNAMLETDSKAQMIEKAARERLGYVYSDEQIFIDISGN